MEWRSRHRHKRSCLWINGKGADAATAIVGRVKKTRGALRCGSYIFRVHVVPSAVASCEKGRAGNQCERSVTGAYLENGDSVGCKIVIGINKVVLCQCRDGEQQKRTN